MDFFFKIYNYRSAGEKKFFTIKVSIMKKILLVFLGGYCLSSSLLSVEVEVKSNYSILNFSFKQILCGYDLLVSKKFDQKKEQSVICQDRENKIKLTATALALQKTKLKSTHVTTQKINDIEPLKLTRINSILTDSESLVEESQSPLRSRSISIEHMPTFGSQNLMYSSFDNFLDFYPTVDRSERCLTSPLERCITDPLLAEQCLTPQSDK